MQRMKFSDQMRQAIETSGKTRYRISKESGISQASLSRFMAGKQGFSADTIDLICECLGLEVRLADQPNRRSSKRGINRKAT
jgi:transcriptional regulator with XRE-family HTH domain